MSREFQPCKQAVLPFRQWRIEALYKIGDQFQPCKQAISHFKDSGSIEH